MFMLLTVSASHVHANDDSSMDKLEVLILDNANITSENRRGNSTNIVRFPKHCLISTKSITRNNGKVWITNETKIPIDLAKLDPSTVEPILTSKGGNFLLAHSTDDKILFDYVKTFYLKHDIDRTFEAYDCDINKCPPVIEKASSYVSLSASSIKNIELVAKAFTLLIKLCGGKEQ